MNTVAFLSGKGGTGKTSLTVAVAKALALEGHRVGLLDADSTGANAHRLLPVEEPYSTFDVTGEPPTIKPAVAKFKDAEPILFVGMALVSESYVNWSGESHGEFVKQMMERTDWGDLDYLLIDCPPGTHSDAREAIQWSDVVVLVTTPSELARLDAQRTLDLVTKMEKPVAGIYVNFDVVVCPNCRHRFHLFRGGAGEVLWAGHRSLQIIERVPWIHLGLPEMSTKRFIRCVENPVTLKPRQRSRLKRGMMEFFFRGLGRKAIQKQEQEEEK